ncbi:MAG: nucleotidyl transferase AbiEii/AbiGii toxin family protein [Sulfuritalea sp.]|nr:nucleotidyl transferase AbiEii/AbiGii toxin family protein [Sulfuritalea sp.]
MSVPLKTKFLPPPTRALFKRLKGEALLENMLLVSGSALALQIGHRRSEDLDFATLESKLPAARIDALMAALEAEGRQVSLLTPQSQIESFRIYTGRKLLDYARNYVVDGAKLTFFARGSSAPPNQLAWLAQSPKSSGGKDFAVLGLTGLFAMKALVLADRARSRDLFDLMVLIRDHGFTIDEAFHLAGTLAPIEKRDVERHKAVMTGAIPLDAEDEGFDSLGLAIGIEDIYAFFGREVDRYERSVARALFTRK